MDPQLKAPEKDYNVVQYEDIIFEGRNVAYGAYELRRKYNDFVIRALGVASLSFLLFLLGPVLYKELMPEPTIEEEIVAPVDLKNLEPPPIDPKTPPPPPMPVTPPPPQVSTIRFVPPEIAPDEEVIDEAPPEQQELNKVAIGSENIEGDPNADPNIQPIEIAEGGTGTGVVGEPVEEAPFQYAETMPAFPGGEAEMMSFIKKNIKYPQQAQKMDIQGTVFVEFVVNSDGKLSNIKVVEGRSVGYGLDDEAIRVVRMMPDWNPGKNSGRPVRVRMTIPIKFKLA